MELEGIYAVVKAFLWMADRPEALAHVVAISRNQFFVRDNFDTIKWPKVCCACGTTTERTVDKWVQGEVTGYGWVRVDIKDIPYCEECQTKTSPRRYLNAILIVIAGFLAVVAVVTAIALGVNWGISFPLLVAAGLLVLIPLRVGARLWGRLHFLKGLPTEDEEQFQISLSKDKPGGVVIQIPNQICADLFAGLNNAIELERRTREPASV